jgi:hypothetical protein
MVVLTHYGYGLKVCNIKYFAGQYEDSSDEWCSSEEELEKDAEHHTLEGEPEQEEEEGAAELLDSLYCVACDKLFRTEGAKVMSDTCLLLYLGILLETSWIYLVIYSLPYFLSSFCLFLLFSQRIVRILILISSIR